MVLGGKPGILRPGRLIMTEWPLVYIIVLTHNHSQDTLAALDSLAAMTYPNCQLLVVDNHSTDGTLDLVKSAHPRVETLANEENVGFAAGVNIGISHAVQQDADLVLLVNNDVIVSPDMLTRLVASIGEGVAVAAPLIYYMDDPQRIWSAGFIKQPILLEARGGMRGKIDPGRWPASRSIDYVLGCAMLIDCAALRQVGQFDERFFFYYEDLDFSLRVKKAGYDLVMVPEARMWHKGAGSAGMETPFRAYHMARGSVIFFRTHVHGWRRFLVLGFRLASACRTIVRFLYRGQPHLIRHYWLGLREGWRAAS
jgi:GT2 family glycosyltransferase